MGKEKALAKLNEIIGMMEHHQKETEPYNRMTFRKFTYENHEFSSCLVCGHSDKALIYELNKLRKLIGGAEPKVLP